MEREPFLAMERGRDVSTEEWSEKCTGRKIREWSEIWFQGGRGWGHELRYTGSSKSWKGQGNGFSSRASKKNHNPVTTLILAQWPCVKLLTFRSLIMNQWSPLVSSLSPCRFSSPFFSTPSPFLSPSLSHFYLSSTWPSFLFFYLLISLLTTVNSPP